MNETELFEAFLVGYPNSTNTYDCERFIRYAFCSAHNHRAFDREAFGRAHVEKRLTDSYETAYPWMRDIVAIQERGEKL